jgi:hypothetical protein
MENYIKLNHYLDTSKIIKFENAIVHKSKNRRIKIFPNIDNIYLIEIGRLLTKEEVVHHIDHNPLNNNIDNLMLFANNSLHKKYESQEKNNERI